MSPPFTLTTTFQTYVFESKTIVMYKTGETALHLAAATGHTEACRVLLECGANVSARNKVRKEYTRQ
jgi:hypothetical protein